MIDYLDTSKHVWVSLILRPYSVTAADRDRQDRNTGVDGKPYSSKLKREHLTVLKFPGTFGKDRENGPFPQRDQRLPD